MTDNAFKGGINEIDLAALFSQLGIAADNPGAFAGEWSGGGDRIDCHSPIDGRLLGRVAQADKADYDRVMAAATAAFEQWRMVPAPRRGEIVRQIGEALRQHKAALGALVTIEMGKIRAEGEGEVQEMIDICDFAVGLSRQLYGLTMHSERPGHRMYEQWHPRGVVGIISAFNFPVAVWAWNSALAWVCGNACVWKPSEKAPLTAIACTRIAAMVFERNGYDPALASLLIGDGPGIGELMTHDERIPLISATGSTRMGKRVGAVVAARLGHTILELGGNNAIIISPSADLDMAIPAIVFGSCGTAGQRCTSTRRVFIHDSQFEDVKNRLVNAYSQVRIGDPLAEGTLMGPLIDKDAIQNMMASLRLLSENGGTVLCGGDVLTGEQYSNGHYVTPCIAEARNDMAVVQQETFAPILYLIRYSELEQAFEWHNDVPQGLSSAIFTLNLREAEQFLSHCGSDCGIANVNIGTSGAEIGGAFGGEKETGGGRESGSDAWKAYMRRQTNTINWSTDLPLAQGISFELG
ncbi:MAG: aldehyde dehydrogenase family protein [Planctomycetales bacterium]|nr:MAG: aldehyde dehydrogenase family protein [Planctomycetales bacterium]